jgi:hypothetical protein
MRFRANTYRQALGSTGAQHIIILLLAALLPDSGTLFEVCAFAALAFWVGVGFIWLRRRLEPTSTDLLFIEAGFVPLYVLACLLSFWIWHKRGVL